MITFERFSKGFGAVDAVTDLSLTIEPGEIVALLGPNGSGKTTSIKAAAGLIRPSAGEVRLGVPGRPASEAEARRLSSFLPQKVSFPDALTGRDVLDFYCDAARLALEVDGGSHSFGDRPERDQRRDAWLAEQGVTTLRLPASLILEDVDDATRTILQHLESGDSGGSA